MIVASVPHSGSRSLLKHLGEPFVSPDKLWHFGYHDHLIKTHVGALHIPLRHPVDIAVSWMNRNKEIAEMVRCMGVMVDYVHPLCVAYKTEDLDHKVGHRPGKTTRNRAKKLLLEAAPDKVLEFYEQHGGYQI